MNKGDFIIDLLTNKKISQRDRERILKLSAKEFEKNDHEYLRILNEIESLKKNYQVEQDSMSTKIDVLIGEIKTLYSNDSSILNNEKTTKIESSQKKNITKASEFVKKVTHNNKIEINENKALKVLHKKEKSKTSKINNNLPTYLRPSYLFEFLFSYNQNHILKSTCHEIDSNELEIINKYCESQEYKFEIHLEKIINEFKKLEKKNYYAPAHMKALIRGYLTGKNFEGKELKDGWSTDNIKYNWSNILIKKYTNDNCNTPPNLSKEILRSRKIKPCKIEQITSHVNGNTVQTFRELVLHFKNLFHIKNGNSFKSILIKNNEIKKWNESVEFIINDETFPSNIELFTDVDKLVQAYNELLKLIISEHNLAGKPKVILSLVQKESTVEFSIHHLENQYSKSLLDTVERMGQTYTNLINLQINGVCNLYLNADFGGKQFAKVNIWNGNLDRYSCLLSEFSGVEHIIEFEKI